MEYINNGRTIKVEWAIMRDRHVKEDLQRAGSVKFILHTPSGRELLKGVSGTNPVVLTLPTPPLTEGEYGVECIWTKNKRREIIKGGGKVICKAKADAIFFATSDTSKAPSSTAVAKVKVKSYVGIYGYDGLDAWELAVLRGKTDMTESAWTSLFDNLKQALDEGTYPSTGDYAVDADFTPENTNHLATTGAIYNALKTSVGYNKMDALAEEGGLAYNPDDLIKKLPFPRTAAVVNITMDTTGDFLHKPGAWSKIGTVEYFDKDGNYFVKNAHISRQGDTSVGMAESNIKIDFDSTVNPAEVSNVVDYVQFGDWVPQNAFHLKAYFIDVFRGVSIVGYRLAEQAIQQLNCRPNRFKNTADNTTEYNGEGVSGGSQIINAKDFGSDALCHPDGFPVEVFVNEEYYGLMALALRKNRANYQMKKSNQQEVLLEGTLGYNTTQGEEASGFFQPNDGLIDWSQIEFKNPGTPSEQGAKARAKQIATASWNAYFGEYNSSTGKYAREELITNGTDAEKAEAIEAAKADWEAVYDKDAVLMYFLLSQVVYNIDGFGKNWVWSIYDLGTSEEPDIHAAPTVYDLDSVFGRNVFGSAVIEGSTTKILGKANPRHTPTGGETVGRINYGFALPTAFAWYMYKNELNEMYAQLRKSGVFSTKNIVNLLKEWMASCGKEAFTRNMRNYAWGVGSDNPIPSYRDTNLNTAYWKIASHNPQWVREENVGGSWVYVLPDGMTEWNAATQYAAGDKCWAFSKPYDTDHPQRRLYWQVECVQACTNEKPLDVPAAMYSPYDLGMFDSVNRVEKWLEARFETLDDEYAYVAPSVTDITELINELGDPSGIEMKKGEIVVEAGQKLSSSTHRWPISIPKGTEFTVKVEDPDNTLLSGVAIALRIRKSNGTNIDSATNITIGQEYSFLATDNVAAITLSSGSTIATDADGTLLLTYKHKDGGLFGRVNDLEEATEGELNEKKGNLVKGSDVNFLMFSDVHEDKLAVQHIMKRAAAWKDDISFVINGGDTVRSVNNNGTDWYNGTEGLVKVAFDAGVRVFDVVGNHDAWKTTAKNWDTDANIYNMIIAPMVTRGIIPDGSAYNLLYYSKDFPDGTGETAKVRFIVLSGMEELEDGETTPTQHLWNSAQATFLTQALNTSLPVVIVVHCSLDASEATGVDCAFTSWMGAARDTNHEDRLHLPAEAVSIVDSFIQGGGKFVCWLTGHRHRDVVSYVDGGHGKQFCFATGAANHENTRNYDSYRSNDAGEKSYDCYNLIGIDTTRGWLKIMRIGLNTDMALREKNEMVLDYVNGEIIH